MAFEGLGWTSCPNRPKIGPRCRCTTSNTSHMPHRGRMSQFDALLQPNPRCPPLKDLTPTQCVICVCPRRTSTEVPVPPPGKWVTRHPQAPRHCLPFAGGPPSCQAARTDSGQYASSQKPRCTLPCHIAQAAFRKGLLARQTKTRGEGQCNDSSDNVNLSGVALTMGQFWNSAEAGKSRPALCKNPRRKVVDCFLLYQVVGRKSCILDCHHDKGERGNLIPFFFRVFFWWSLEHSWFGEGRAKKETNNPLHRSSDHAPFKVRS